MQRGKSHRLNTEGKSSDGNTRLWLRESNTLRVKLRCSKISNSRRFPNVFTLERWERSREEWPGRSQWRFTTRQQMSSRSSSWRSRSRRTSTSRKWILSRRELVSSSQKVARSASRRPKWTSCWIANTARTQLVFSRKNFKEKNELF